jgi:phosphatidylserine decarboxylase precursor-related protein
MVKDGIPFIVVPAAIAAVLLFFHWWVFALVFIVIAAFMAFFFRDPKRTVPTEANIVVSAADGRVTRIDKSENGKLVSVFLSPVDVHINRAPIAGKITKVEYTRGRKSPATSDNASLVNERNSLTIEGEKMTVVCTQIAGILARRIVCWNKPGDDLDIGQRFGLIKFGSRTDVLMPVGVDILVGIGDRVVGGETIIARLG